MNAQRRFVTRLACIVALVPMTAESQQPTACSASPYRQFDAWWPEVSSVERLPDRHGQEVWTLRQPTGELPMQVIESTAAERLVTRIADDNLPFGGTWTYELQEQDGGTLVTVTEDGEIYNPFFRVMSKLIFGYHRTQESYLSALAQKFGEEVVIKRLR